MVSTAQNPLILLHCGEPGHCREFLFDSRQACFAREAVDHQRLPRWIPVGAKAGFCECRGDTVKIDMRLFGVELSDDDEEIEDEAGDQLEGPVSYWECHAIGLLRRQVAGILQLSIEDGV